MRIAHINMTHSGSTGRIMLNIAQTSKLYGHKSRTYSPRLYVRGKISDEPHIENHFYWGNRFESFFHYYLGTLLGINGMLSHVGTKQLIKDLKDFNPDVIHLHNLHNYSINLKLLFRYIKENNIKVVWTLHDCWPFTGHCPYFDIVKCDKWTLQCGQCPQKYVYPKTYIDTTKWMLKKKKKLFSDIKNLTIVTPSAWLAGKVKQSFLAEYPTCIINNGIDLSTFYPMKNQIKEKYKCEDKFMLLGVAFDWGKRKGLDVFVELAQRLDKSYQIVLVGTNDYIDELLPSNIISIHRTNSVHELAQLYTAADLFVNPTREDNYPTVNMEALACGTPVLSFNTGGSAEIFDETCGQEVKRDDIDALISEIREICTNKKFSTEACVNRAQSFNMKEKFMEYINLYEKI